jgi:putative ATPase
MNNVQLPPLAERMRPQTIDEYSGQQHLVGSSAVLRKAIESGTVPSLIFWGPPGVGKTTLAQMIAQYLNLPFFALSAIQAGVKEVRAVFEKTETVGKSILFIDEIHRFNKAQQDALLSAVERGKIILMGATTENPSFEVISALLSRCQVYILKSLDDEELNEILQRALTQDEVLRGLKVEVKETDALFHLCGGDGRKLLNLLELAISQQTSDKKTITNDSVMNAAQNKMAIYDKSGELHYDVISAFIKSMRGSDPNAAVYWLARMLKGGEDPKFIARRMVILASEDIGNANPNALLLATNTFQAITQIGMPEGRIILSQTAVYLASSPKSNASYMAIKNAESLVHKTGDLPVPLHLRNGVTKLMKDEGYGKDYKYAHDHDKNFVELDFLPEKVDGTTLYDPGNNVRENELRRFLKERWKEKYGY